MAIHAEPDLGELADPSRLAPQHSLRGPVQLGRVKGKGHRGFDFAGKAVGQIEGVLAFACHHQTVVQRGVTEGAQIGQGSCFAVELGIDRIRAADAACYGHRQSGA